MAVVCWKKLWWRSLHSTRMTRVITTPTTISITLVHPDADISRQALRAYFIDIVSRYYGRQATGVEIDAAMAENFSGDLKPPDGLFWVAPTAQRLLVVLVCARRRAGAPGGVAVTAPPAGALRLQEGRRSSAGRQVRGWLR
jgi:hypothetical protein